MLRISAAAPFLALLFVLLSVDAQSLSASDLPGDDYPGITIESLPFTDSLNTAGATTEPGEPIASCLFGAGAPSATIWYNFTPSLDMLLRVDTLGSDYDTVTAVWTLSAFPGAPLGEVTCSDDFSQAGDSGRVFAAEAGRTYYIQAGGYPFSSGTGNLVVHLQEVLPPTNDDVGDAKSIDTIPFTDLTDNGGASTEGGEPVPSCIYDAQIESTLWYTFEPEQSGAYLADTLNSDFDSVVAVYTGTPGALTELWCNDDGGYFSPQARLGFEVEAGTVYYIQIGGYSFSVSSGSLELRLDALEIPECVASGNAVSDPAGDSLAILRKDYDIVSVRDGVGADSVCLRVEFADDFGPGALASSLPLTFIAIDTDSDPLTGAPSLTDFYCDSPSGIGEGAEVVVQGGNLLAVMLIGLDDSPGSLGPLPFEGYGYVSFDEDALTVTLPLDMVGGDGTMNVAMVVANELEISDCAPDEGHISLPIGARNQGDIDCDGDADAVDAQRLLSYLAALPLNLPGGCESPGFQLGAATLGDVDCDGDVDSVDVLDILRRIAGLPVQQNQPCTPIGQPLPLG